MYLLFRYHGIKPSEYHEMVNGERTVIRSFMHYEIDRRSEEIDRLNNLT